ncbi:MAG: hypothetical protein M3Q07_19845 [Pseudobdellovibrionaceae bacterium]|nr:hypothetical protein [Pseudobdellovibrionaceae bacterium]
MSASWYKKIAKLLAFMSLIAPASSIFAGGTGGWGGSPALEILELREGLQALNAKESEIRRTVARLSTSDVAPLTKNGVLYQMKLDGDAIISLDENRQLILDQASE